MNTRLRPGAVQLEIGVQSTCEKTIAEIHRKMDFTRVAAIVRRISSWQNIHVHLDLIAGLPFEALPRFQDINIRESLSYTGARGCVTRSYSAILSSFRISQDLPAI